MKISRKISRLTSQKKIARSPRNISRFFSRNFFILEILQVLDEKKREIYNTWET